MYATVRTYTGNPRLADALAARQADIKALMGKIAGFKAYYLVRTADGAVSVSVFDSEAGARESTNVAANWLHESPGLAGPAPKVSSGEVVISA